MFFHVKCSNAIAFLGLQAAVSSQKYSNGHHTRSSLSQQQLSRIDVQVSRNIENKMSLQTISDPLEFMMFAIKICIGLPYSCSSLRFSVYTNTVTLCEYTWGVPFLFPSLSHVGLHVVRNEFRPPELYCLCLVRIASEMKSLCLCFTEGRKRKRDVS